MKQVVESVTLFQTKTLIIEEKTCDEMNFSYRDSLVKHEPYIVLETRLRLPAGNKEEISALIEDLRKRRIEKQPLEFPSAGSTFKRPEGYFAGKLIEDSGLRGYRVGDAQVSEKHCGFVINRGNATAKEIWKAAFSVCGIIATTALNFCRKPCCASTLKNLNCPPPPNKLQCNLITKINCL